ncbi:MAG: TPR end-of-group domain-containing protein [Acidobacteriota bacterium]
MGTRFALALAALCLAGSAGAQTPAALEPGVVHPKVLCQGDPSHSYALYLPRGYHPGRPWPVLFCLSPTGQGEVPLRLVKDAAEAGGYIVAASNDSRNGPWQPILEAQQALWKDVSARFPMASSGHLAMGFSGGARAALHLALTHRDRFRGVISCGAFYAEQKDLPRKSGLSLYLLTGNRDFNRFEMGRALETEPKRGNRVWLQVFEGKHRWPDAAQFGQALAFFAAEEASPGDPLRSRWAADRAGEAEDLLQKGRSYEAYRLFTQIARLYPEVPAGAAAAGKAAALERTEEVISARARDRRFEDLWGRLKAVSSQDQLLGLIRELRKLKAAGGEDSEDAEDLLQLNALSLEQLGVQLLRAGRYDEAAFCLETAALVLPSHSILNYNAACALARAGRSESAMEFLEKAVAAGFKDRALASKDSDLDSLRKHPRFQRLLDGMGPGS